MRTKSSGPSCRLTVVKALGSVTSGGHEIEVKDEKLIKLTEAVHTPVAANAASIFAEAIGLSKTSKQMLITAIYELGTNILKHAGCGELLMQIIKQGDALGVRVIATDDGPGIEDVDKAMVDGFTTQPQFRSLGLGLGGISRLMDEMMINTALNQGTQITACKWMKIPE